MKIKIWRIWQFLSLFFMLFSMPVAVVLFQEATSFLTRADGVPANITIDISKADFAKPSVWANFAQGGEERTSMLGSVIEEVKALDANHIRLDHIYDFYDIVGRDSAGKLTCDWSRLDEQVNGILKTGARPFFALTYMPEVISAGNEVDNPRVWSEWAEVVQKTIEHYSGINELGIRGVYYEVWNEPDLFGGFKLYGSKNYLTLYQYAAQGAVQAQNVYPFKLGGPATTALYRNWVRDFLTFTKNNSLKIDFYSWHRYSTDMEAFEEDLKLVRELRDEFPEYKNLELIVSETGYSSENNDAFDTNLGAVHSLATVAVYDQEIDKLFSFELKDGPGSEKYWGRWGILTHEKWGPPEKKPRYMAFEFLNRIVGKHVEVSGEGTWVKAMARLTSEKLYVLVVNYDNHGKNLEAVPIKFTNLPERTFTYKKYEFLGEEGIERTVSVQGSEWQTTELLNPNSAIILELGF